MASSAAARGSACTSGSVACAAASCSASPRAAAAPGSLRARARRARQGAWRAWKLAGVDDRPRRLTRRRSGPVSAQHSPRCVSWIRFMADRPSLQGFSAVLRSLETARCGGGARRRVPHAPVQQREREARVKVPGGAHVRAPAGRRHGRAAAAPRRRRRLQRVRPHLRIVCLSSALVPCTTLLRPQPGRRRLRSPPAARLPLATNLMRCGGGSSQARPRTHAFVPWSRRGAHCPGHSSCMRRRLSSLSIFDASRKPVAERARRGMCQYQRIAAPHRRTGSAPRAARPRRAAAPAAARRAARCRRVTRPTRGGAPCAPRRPRAPTRATRCACAPPLARGRPPLRQPPCRDVACPLGGRARVGRVPPCPCRRRSNQHGCIAQQRSLSLVLP